MATDINEREHGIPGGRRAYLATLRWLLLDAFWRRRYASAAVIAMGFGASAARVAVIGILLTYARAFSRGGTVDILGTAMEARGGALLTLIAGVMFIALVAAAGIDYAALNAGVRLSFAHEDFCRRRLFGALARFATFPAPMAGFDEPSREIARSSTLYCRLIGRAVRQSFQTPPALFQALFGLIIMLALDWMLTFGLLVLLLPVLLALTKVNRVGMAAMNRLPDVLREYQREHQSFYLDIVEAHTSPRIVRPRARTMSDAPAHRAFNDCRHTQITMTGRAKMLSEGATALAFLLILVFFGLSDGRWGELIGFVIAARWALQGAQQLATTVTSINRFMPATHTYHAVLAGLTEPLPPRVTPGGPLVMRAADKPQVADSMTAFEFARGRPVVLVTDRPVDRFSLLAQLGPFRMDGETRSMLLRDTYVVRSNRRPSPGTTWRELLQVGSADRAEVIASLDAAGFEDADSRLPAFAEAVDEVVWRLLPRAARGACTATAASRAGSLLVVLDDTVIQQVGRAMPGLLAQMHSQYVLLVVGSGALPRGLDEVEVASVVVLSSGRLWGIGDRVWYERHGDALSSSSTLHGSSDDADEAQIELMMSE